MNMLGYLACGRIVTDEIEAVNPLTLRRDSVLNIRWAHHNLKGPYKWKRGSLCGR